MADPQVICFRCKQRPEQIMEYVIAAKEWTWDAGHEVTPTHYVVHEEGTYNPETGHFACTECYIAIGQPTAPPPGWKAP